MAQYQPNQTEVAAYLLSRELRDAVEDVAQVIASRTRTNTPRETGATAAEITVQTGLIDTHAGQAPRVAARVVGGPVSVALEFGTVHTRASRPMRRALEGLR